jgi:hypothetical protein
LEEAPSAPVLSCSAPRGAGEFPTSGFLFKDTVKVIALDDKQVDNVMIYLTGEKWWAGLHQAM